MKKIVLVTSLYRLRKHQACKDRYDHLVDKLGPEWGDKDEIDLLDILKHNGTADCLWALCSIHDHPEARRVMRLMAADFAEAVLPIFEKEYPDDKRPRLAIKAARDFANGKITAQERDAATAAARPAAGDAALDAARAAWDAAWDAAGVAARAAWAAAWDAATAAERDAAWAATAAERDAARAAAWDAAWAAQAKIIRRYLGRGK
jgi:hypothetical protein